MRGKRVSYLFLISVLLLASLFIYACSGGGGGGPAGPPISDTPMQINEANAKAEIDDIFDLLDMKDTTEYLGFADLTGSIGLSVQSVGDAVITGDMSKVNIDGLVEGLLPMTQGTCPTMTYPDPPAGGGFPNPFVVTIDYGGGCIPVGQSDMYSGSITFSLSNIRLTGDNTASTLSANYSLTFNALTSPEGTMNGSIAGNINITTNAATSAFSGSLSATFTNFTDGENTLNGTLSISLTDVLLDAITNQLTGTVAVSFSNFSDGTDTLNGSISAALDVNIFTQVGTITYTYTNFTDGYETLAGTLVITLTSTTATYDFDLQTSTGPIIMTVQSVFDELAGTVTINTVGTGTYQGVSITITDVVGSQACDQGPISGTIVLSDDTTTATITFGPNCGDIPVVVVTP